MDTQNNLEKQAVNKNSPENRAVFVYAVLFGRNSNFL